MLTKEDVVDDRNGARRRSGAPAAPVHGHAAQGPGAGGRRDDDPGHRAAQPGRGRAHRGRRGRRVRRRRGPRPPGRAGAAARRDADPGRTTTRPRSGTTPTRSGWPGSTSTGACCWSTATPCTRSSVETTLLAERGPGILLAVDTVKKLADEEMKTVFDDAGRLTRITKLMDPAAGVRGVHRRDADRAARRRGAGRRAGDDLAARPEPLLRGRLPGVRRRAAARSARPRSATSPGSRSTTTTTWSGRGRSRATTSPHDHHPARHRRAAGRGGRPGRHPRRRPDLRRR